jgi:hypothetical protein
MADLPPASDDETAPDAPESPRYRRPRIRSLGWEKLMNNETNPAPSNPYGSTDQQPDITGWTPDQAKAHLANWEAQAAKTPGHPLYDRGNPHREAVLKFKDDLYKVAYPEPGAAGEDAPAAAPALDAMGALDRANSGAINWGRVEFDGKPLSPEDREASTNAVAGAITTLGLGRIEAGQMVAALGVALHNGARAPVTVEAAQKALVQQFGVEGATQAVADARSVLEHLEASGIPARAALGRANALNDPVLVATLAKLAARLPSRG